MGTAGTLSIQPHMATDAFRLFARPRGPAPGTAHGVMEAAVLQVPVLGKAELRAACLAVLGFVPDKVRDQPQKHEKGCVFLVGFLKAQREVWGCMWCGERGCVWALAPPCKLVLAHRMLCRWYTRDDI